MVVGTAHLRYGTNPVGIGGIIIKIIVILVIGNFRRNIKNTLGIMPFLQLKHDIFIPVQHGNGRRLKIKGVFILVIKLYLTQPALIGFNDQNSVGTPGTIDSRGGSIFQNFNRFDILEGNIDQVTDIFLVSELGQILLELNTGEYRQ